jgi:hypothetical protein
VDITPGLTLVPRAGQVDQFLPRGFENLVGIIDACAIRGADAVFLASWSDFKADKAESADVFLTSLLRTVQQYLMALWLLRDHCIMCDDGVLLCSEDNVGLHGIKHSLGQYFWNAVVKHVRTTFASAELLEACRLATLTNALFSSGPVEVYPTAPKGMNRLQRALYYIENARMCSDVGLRVASYMSCFEVLFSTDSAEISHKLAERVAVFVSQEPAERLKVYGQVKLAYSIRSKIVHGDELSNKQSGELLDLSRLCDDLLRKIILYILSSKEVANTFLLKNTELDQFFIGQIMGQNSVA